MSTLRTRAAWPFIPALLLASIATAGATASHASEIVPAARATSTQDSGLPSAPTSFNIVMPGSGDRADLSWSEPAAGDPFRGYEVTHTDPAHPGVVIVRRVTGTQTTFQNLMVGETYTFTVAARNEDGLGARVTLTVTLPVSLSGTR